MRGVGTTDCNVPAASAPARHRRGIVRGRLDGPASPADRRGEVATWAANAPARWSRFAATGVAGRNLVGETLRYDPASHDGCRDRGTRTVRFRPAYDVIALVVLAYLPFLLSSRGRLSSDTKQYLYLDPGRFLARVPWLWDPHVAAGTVPHQQLGYLFPMGPFFWLADLVGTPDWIAQRLWLGTISVAAALGARWLFRRLGLGPMAAFVAALVYVLTPYQLAFTARISVLLLPWAALPWIVGLTMRAVHRGGWRDPAAIALIILTIGGVNASALVLVGLAPALWIGLELFGGRGPRPGRARRHRPDRRPVARGLGVVDRRPLPPGFTRPADPAAHGERADRLGVLHAGRHPARPRQLVLLRLRPQRPVARAVAGLRRQPGRGGLHLPRPGPRVPRRRTRPLAPSRLLALCIVVGTAPHGRAPGPTTTRRRGVHGKRFTSDTSAGLALRNPPRVVPVVVLGVAGLAGAGIGALRPATGPAGGRGSRSPWSSRSRSCGCGATATSRRAWSAPTTSPPTGKDATSPPSDAGNHQTRHPPQAPRLRLRHLPAGATPSSRSHRGSRPVLAHCV